MRARILFLFAVGLSVSVLVATSQIRGSAEARPTPAEELKNPRVENIRLKDAPAIDGAKSMVLTFDLVNTESIGVADIVVEASVVAAAVDQGRPPKTMAGPYVIRGSVVLESDNAITYTLRLRNLSSDCGCIARVFVRTARPVSAAAARTSARL